MLFPENKENAPQARDFSSKISLEGMPPCCELASPPRLVDEVLVLACAQTWPVSSVR